MIYKYNLDTQKVEAMSFFSSHLNTNSHFVAFLIATEATYVIYSHFRNFHIAFLKPAP